MTTTQRKPKLVLVHGIFNTGSVMNWMRRQFESQGFECFTPTLKPFDGSHGVEYAANNLKEQIDNRYGENQTLVLIGFSMGGIVARYYLQHLEGCSRSSHLFTISTPHSGSYMAYLPYPSKAMKQLRPDSELLKSLDESTDRLDGLKLYSYRTSIDYTIVPSTSSHWELAENKKFFVALHLSMVFSSKITNEILARLNE
ncbi:lipase [Shewanella psychropiezotolerans]|uniref:Lipase n=1 Tax=Shewanella psychropiezotolerans TaxID=2593655 RepID=A0ABX5WTD3_9GAMM|nr:lipase [Shewanella psychropiezotolerans]QDO82334.1 lipase [Shewanella psychropiezotolerans]